MGCRGLDCGHYGLISHEMVKLSCSLFYELPVNIKEGYFVRSPSHKST